uniref:Ubiquitin associated protein 2-like n=1 Tax=Oncorhynchus mykiss TaxID=8022 RepID=A0A8C7U1F6_ONCMY
MKLNYNQPQCTNNTAHRYRDATAEQIRLAQMISDHNDADFEEKVKQLIDITGKDQDESMIALHDCNGDVNRAINVLLEGSPDTDSWEMVGKKKGVSGQKEPGHAETGEEGKDNRERGAERDVARRRGGAPRRGRGASRGREFRGQENGLDGGKAAGIAGRGTERGHRGRGRGRGSGCAQNHGFFSCRTFNPADYAEPTQTEESYGRGSTWNNTGNLEPEEGARIEYTAGGEGTNYQPKFDSVPSAWRSATEEWGTEDWNEDLSETKIFTASSVASMPLPRENVTITAGQRIDLAVLLGKTPPSSSEAEALGPMKASQPPSLPQSLVFSNSKQGVPLSQPPSSSTPYNQHSVVSMLSKGFGEVGDPKGGSTGTTSGSQFLEQFKTAQALAQLAAQHSQTGQPSPSSWDTSPAALGQYDMNAQPEPAAHSPFTKRQPYQSTSVLDAFLPPSVSSSLPPQSTPSSLMAPPVSSLPKMTVPPGQQVSTSSPDAQGSSPLPLQQHKLKQQKKRTSITTKIPATPVEMPGSADISGLNLQFGVLQFGSEPVLQEYDIIPATTSPGCQVQNCLYTSPSSEATPSLSNPSQMDMYDQRAPQARRYPTVSSPQKDIEVSLIHSLRRSYRYASLRFIPPLILCLFLDKYKINCCVHFSLNSSLWKAPPNLPPGVPPLLPNPYIMAPGLLHAYPPQVYGYDDLQMLQTRIPLDYYSIPFATPNTALTGRDGSLSNNPYSGDLSKFGRGDASSPAPATTLAQQTQQNQSQTHHTTQQPFLNPALPPGYSYTSLPYYTGVPGLPNTFQYGPAMFPVAPTSSKQHGVNVGVNASATAFQQASAYGSHGYNTGYEDMGQASGSGDFCKGGYGTAVAAAASAQSKQASSVSGPGVGVSVTSSNTGVPDISGSVYTKTQQTGRPTLLCLTLQQQSFEKQQGFHATTPATSFSLPSALGSGGPINPPAAAGYAPAPFMHILAPHQQPLSQILHHHLQQDGQSGTGQRSQNASLQQKTQINKSAYNSYNWGAN